MTHASLRVANLLGAVVVALGDQLPVSADDAALVSLSWNDGLSVDGLADVVGLSQPGTVRLIDRLADAGLVRRGQGADGRTRALHLSAKGRRRAERVLADREVLLADTLGAVRADEARLLETTLSRILARLTVDESTAYRICRLCDEAACGPGVECPVERALGLAP